ncbi:MAG: hypothetical protein KME59_11060 [Trichormus sp. ATA11-4-KO1]|jgi:Ser/Thr protein kinase RdoA (MazF antagonist)|nr:hypothetical protein [Trichormus sp. ATA11-4-KO1]
MMNDKTFLHLAVEALRNYGLENAQLTRLGGASNINFKVDVDDISYLLRLHTSALHNRDTIWSELVWLSSLRGFGFYLYDLALALMELEEQQQKVFLQGYESVKPLPADYTNLKQVFLCLAYLDNLGFLVANPEELAFVMKELPLVVAAFCNAVETVL